MNDEQKTIHNAEEYHQSIKERLGKLDKKMNWLLGILLVLIVSYLNAFGFI